MGTEDAVITNEADSTSTSDLENQIIRQVEYYFGNYNLCRDKFLKHMVKENDGWIPMDIMIKFKRLKMLSEDISVITDALKKSPNKLIEVHEDGTKIRRSAENPLPENTSEQKQEVESRTVYVKGFHANTSLDELLKFFEPHGNPENILMRRRPNKKFKGSVFVTFNTKADAEKFQQAPSLKFKSTELLKEMKRDYVKRKDDFYSELRKQRQEKQRIKQEQKVKKEEEDEGKKEEEDDEKEDGDVKKGKKSAETPSEAVDEDIVKGCLLKLTNLGEETMWEHIKEVLSPHATIAYVDYSKGKPEAVVRFHSGVAAEVLEKVGTDSDGSKVVHIKDNDAVGTILEGEEEIEYWKNISKFKAELKQKQSRRGWQNRGGKRGGYQGRGRFNQRGKRKHGGGRSDDDDEGPSPKKVDKAEGKQEDSDMPSEP